MIEAGGGSEVGPMGCLLHKCYFILVIRQSPGVMASMLPIFVANTERKVGLQSDLAIA